ncbi:hypothetical protein CSUI_006978, partial [Cystoisospora suis]
KRWGVGVVFCVYSRHSWLHSCPTDVWIYWCMSESSVPLEYASCLAARSER